MKRTRILSELLDDHNCDAETLLDLLVRSLSNADFQKHMEFVLRQNDFPVWLSDNGEIILPTLDGEFETGATNHETNEFILTAVNDATINAEIKDGTNAEDIRTSYRKLFHPELDLDRVNLLEAESYFHHYVRN